MDKRFFPLSVITKRINELLQPAISKQFWVKAEIASGRERAGSFFCDLIETGANGKITAKLSCTIWPQELTSIRNSFKASNMDLVLSDGTVVGFLCSLRYSPQYGLSLSVLDADPSIAVGEMELKKREIIERLQMEGLFEPNKERFVPLLPLTIGLITSAGSAAYNDFIQTLTASGFGFRIHLADAMMQGEQVEKSVLKALDRLSRSAVDLIVIARGGGSKTDLGYLDNEAIARRIAACPIPVWTGIGHEIDTSVLDYVANKSFKTPTAAAEELTARFIQMRRQLDEAVNTLKTVWAYRLKINLEYQTRARTGIQQGARKLLDVTASSLRSQAQELRIRVKGRITTESISIGAQKERLRARPTAILHNNRERIASRRQRLEICSRIALSGATTSLSSIRQRFDRERFLRRVRSESSAINNIRQQMKSRSLAALKVKIVQQTNLKDRFRLEKIQYRIDTERKSLNGKMATIKASDPQIALQRGFALVYSQDGQLVRSINDIAINSRINTRLSDGSITSEVTAKEKQNA